MKNKISNRVLSCALTLMMALALLPVTALAADGVPYLDANGNSQTANNVTEINLGSLSTFPDLTSGWYIVRGSQIFTSAFVTVTGDVSLILADGCDMNVTGAQGGYAGIWVDGSNSLTIYAQSTDTNIMGMLTATGGGGAGIGGGGAGIGGGGNIGGTIIINGGTVNATGGSGDGGSDGGGAGIGGGTITINGGTVNAIGGDGSSGGGAGIGSSGSGSSTITINGGTINATGGSGTGSGGNGANIGGGGGGGGAGAELAIVYITAQPSPVTSNATMVTVNAIDATSVALNKTTLTLTVGDSKTLTATVQPSNATNKNVSWSSGDTNVATVDQTGNVMAVAVGTAEITVMTDDGGYTASCTVTVKAASSPSGGSSSGGSGYTPTSQPSQGFSGTTDYVKGAGKDLVHITQKEFSYFDSVRIDSKTLTRNTHYKAESSSTKITLYSYYLDTLTVGKHTLTIYFTDGVTVAAEFTVNDTKPELKPWVNPFNDIHMSDWYYGDVEYVYTNGLMNGTSTSPMLFSPDTPLTRGMMATILYREQGSPNVSGLTNPFSDVAADMYYADAVKWAADRCIVNGYDNRFNPDDNITRQDLAVILWRYAKRAGFDVSADMDISAFGDASEVAEYATDAMRWVCGAGIIKGKPGDLLDLKGTASRAAAAAVLHRMLGALLK